MKVALFEKPPALSVTTKELRPLKPGEVLVKVEACGVCGTDLHIVEGTARSTPPVVLGHEFAGVIEDTAAAPAGWRPGQRVVVDPNISCGGCFYCRRGLVHLCANLRALGVDIDGGMAQYSIVPAQQLYEIPPGLSAEASVFVEPLSCAIHGIDRANICAGDTVVILGGGAIGLLMLQLAKNAGAARTIVVELLEGKRAIARTLGADHVLAPEETTAAVFDLTGVGADVVIECVGRPRTMQLALELARRGGVVEFFGVCPRGEKIPVEPNQVYFRELTIVGSYVNPHTFSRALALLQSGKVRLDAFAPRTFPLEGVPEAFAGQREGRIMKSILRPHA